MRFFVLCIGLLVSSAVHAGTDSWQAFDERFHAAVKKHKIPGAAYAIIEGGSITKTRTYGVRAQGTKDPVTTETVFRLASVSKTFTGGLAALLVKEGRFSYKDKLVSYVPGFRLRTPGHAEQLNIHHILSHSSGLLPNSYDVMLDDGWDMNKILPRFKKLKPICKPGKCYGYQNIVFSLIEPVVEKSTGDSFEAQIEKRFFAPLDMKEASVGLDGFLAASNRAEPHVLTKKGWYKTRVNGNYYAVAPAAGVNASITDLAKWVRAQMGYNADVLPEELLASITKKHVRTKREMYRKVWRPHLSNAHYGYGWRIYEMGGEDIILHAGGVSGFRSLIAFSRERDVGYAMLMNAESRSIDQLGADFWATMIAESPKATAAGR